MRRDVEALAEDADAWTVCRGLVRIANLSRPEWARALSAVLDFLLARLEEARLSRDDRPELVASALRSWAEGGVPIEHLQDARELMRASRRERNTQWFNRDWKAPAAAGLLATARASDAVETAVDFVLDSPLDDCRNLEQALWSASDALATIEDPDSRHRSVDISAFHPESWAQVRAVLLGAVVDAGPEEPASAVELAAAMRAAPSGWRP